MTRWLAISAVVVIFDQWSKLAIIRTLQTSGAIEITPFFNLVLVANPGAAFSFLSNASGWQRELFIGIAVVACMWVIYLLYKYANEKMFCFALSLILGGALGNLIDRVRLGAVIDFLDFHAMGRHFPAFNVADSAITCAALLLIWSSMRPAASKSPS